MGFSTLLLTLCVGRRGGALDTAPRHCVEWDPGPASEGEALGALT